jgi:hypothetical protein
MDHGGQNQNDALHELEKGLHDIESGMGDENIDSKMVRSLIEL